MRRVSPAMVVALIALVFSLAGTSYAVAKLPRNSVGTAQIKNSAVTSTKIKDGSVAPVDLAAAAKAAMKGAKGDTGATGSSGVNSIATLAENPADLALSTTFQTVLTKSITTTTVTTLTVQAVINVFNAGGGPADVARIVCGANLDGTQIGSVGSASSIYGQFGEDELPVLATQTSVPAGTHTVSVTCNATLPSPGAAILFDNGSLVAIAFLQ